MAGDPLVSCIMPTCDRRRFAAQAIRYFLRQDYATAELIIIDDGAESFHDLVPANSNIRYFRPDRRQSIGAKRNLACEQAAGEIILHWDDDDWYSGWRISYQVKQLLSRGAQLCGLNRLLYYDPENDRAFRYEYPKSGKPWVAGNTLCYRKEFWRRYRFLDLNVGEDVRFVWQALSGEMAVLDNGAWVTAIIHSGNVSPKQTSTMPWSSAPISDVHTRLGDDLAFYKQTISARPAALIAASRGIGDILRVTPLIRVFAGLGYATDVLLDPDYAETAGLVENAPEIRKLYTPLTWPTGAESEEYDTAVFSFWAASGKSSVRARRVFTFDRNEWLQHGDSFCVDKVACAVGWQGSLPRPFLVHSNRKFDLAPGTIALHTGCKPDWPWKKWHGFDELAGMLADVVLIGTPADLDNSRTYFPKEFRWPPHVRSFVGQLNLCDTAALLSQCAALVSNDSGLMHLGVAAGVPVFGVFGITSPKREAIPVSNMFPVTKGLSCEPACREQPWGRRDCEHHLQCLKTLTAQEVRDRLGTVINGRRVGATTVSKLGLTYFGHVFDATGYGHAARAYIHALARAGVDLSVCDLSRHERQVSDPFIESLVGRSIRADFQLYHGIPPIWAKNAFRAANTIGMTVWETDTMPAQWRNILNHVLEVWLPCDFNVTAFQAHLNRTVAKVPHPYIERNGHAPEVEPNEFLGLEPHEFVIYSIFEWQDRKSPNEMLSAYLKAFDGSEDTVFILKSNPGAAAAARNALDHFRQETGSNARVQLRCEAWTESQIAALQNRGDCYFSLHRGEGWCYPLFEAACDGTPVVATGYSGPAEYLSPERHRLVRFTMTSVRQQYAYYHPKMQWADPDIDDAAAQLRWVFSNRDAARLNAQNAGEALRRQYSLESVGNLIRDRLVGLLQQSDTQRWRLVRVEERERRMPPPPPIPASWFDADYFENGIKSNWESGYQWRLFEGLFRQTAAFLTTMLPGAKTFFDAGCAKGFLVRTLRERGCDAWGCDFSQWAIEHTDPSVRPFVELASVENVEWKCRYDILLAFHLFSQLTEQQALEFLSRSRDWIDTGIFAVIPTFEAAEEKRGTKGDLAHVTCESRAWWHDRFLRAGWKQDALHLKLQQLLQSQELPRKMGWEIFLYGV